MQLANATDIPPMILVEPASEQSKLRAAAIFARKERQLNIDSIKERLKEIRRNTRANHSVLLETLKTTLSRYGRIRLATARDGEGAAAYIAAVAEDTTLLSLNKSNIVVNELRPALRNAGFRTYLRYFNEFEHFAEGNFPKKIEDYWSLPEMHKRGLVESFDVQKTIGPFPAHDVRNYMAVLGVNAISAADGSVYFLEHMANIAKDLEQAKKIVLIVGLEKITKDNEEALFHTKSMGIFGLETVLLDLVPKDEEKFDFDGLPILSDHAEREFHILLLDNGRSKLLDDGYSDLFLCIDCRACARQCPIGQDMFRALEMIYSPKNLLLESLRGWLPAVEACLHCGRCHIECPVDIDIPSLLWKSQFAHYDHSGRSWKKQVLDDPELLAKLGSWTAPLSNWATKSPMVKMLMELFSGIDRHAHLPSFNRQTFRNWYKGDRHG
jgi:L-lactate utilization protein LutB